ncbi:MAG TPA: cupredoxin domain-containing protein [Candidatus Saccharibacteria bacterium]|nr:cupredoxin domain-containing protein [Candidatus Saccharibacteria bacterium]HMR38676.1 cupredoxin domain-containing protein [Candidatus Saccharibacteria bacterium]
MEKLLVLVGAVLLIGFIVWWFFGNRKTIETEATMSTDKQQVEVTVNGGYTPNTVVLQQGVPASIVFDRKDPSGCFSYVVFPDFGINEELPVGEQHSIDIDTSKPGEYQYACGMNMFHGKVVIK